MNQYSIKWFYGLRRQIECHYILKEFKQHLEKNEVENVLDNPSYG